MLPSLHETPGSRTGWSAERDCGAVEALSYLQMFLKHKRDADKLYILKTKTKHWDDSSMGLLPLSKDFTV